HGLDNGYIIILTGQRINRHVIHIKEDRRATDVIHADIFDVYLFNHSAPAAGRLEADTDIRSQKVAVVNKKIARPARHFAAHDKSAVSVKHRAISDDDVLGGHAAFAPFYIATGLVADAVISHDELTAFYQN